MLTFLLSFPDSVYEIRSFVSSHMVKTSLGCPCFVSGYFFDTQPFKTMTIFTANGVFAFVCLPLRILAKKMLNGTWVLQVLAQASFLLGRFLLAPAVAYYGEFDM